MTLFYARIFQMGFALGLMVLSIQTGHTDSPLRIVFLGDSVTEGYGVAKEDAFPALVEKKLKADGYAGIEIVNAGISGSTSASAERRVRWYLKNPPQVLMLALGANDGLRGLPVAETQKNLTKAIVLAQKNQIQVVLAGMQMPPNYGKKYTTDYKNLFPSLARTFHLPLIPFLLEGVAGHPELNQGDGIHPNKEGHEKIADVVTPEIEKVISKIRGSIPKGKIKSESSGKS